MDCGSSVDLRNEVPDLLPYLRPGERVINVQHAPTPRPDKLLSYPDALCLLGGVNHPKDIGKNGPLSAAKALPGRKNDLGQGLFDHLFGRDGLYAAEDLLPQYPELTRATLHRYAGLLGMSECISREEEFGRMFHESCDPDDPIAVRITAEHGWRWPFYASVDATPLFVRVLAKYCLSSPERMYFLYEPYVGRDGKRHLMFDALRFAMQWLVRRLNSNPEGYLEYKHGFPGSIKNQVMEDSGDSHFHDDGTLPNFEQGIASTEVQGLAYDALCYAAQLYRLWRPVSSIAAQSYFLLLAEHLRCSVLRDLWIEKNASGYFAAGSDRDGLGNIKVMRIKKAIPFFLLDSFLFSQRLLAKNKAALVQTLFSRSMLAAGGIRSLALGQPRFIPGGYHTGNVWLFQTFKIAEGLRTAGLPYLAAELDRRIVKAVEDARMYPEFVRGDTGSEIRLNERIVDTWDSADQCCYRREQPPQQIQLWTLAAYATIKHREESQKKPCSSRFEEDVLHNV